MEIPETLLEIRQYAGEGYRPLIDFGAWRVAIMRYADELLPERLAQMQRHDETDEVFVLLSGRCILYLGEGADRVDAIRAIDMEPLRLYNVKRSAWHTHALSEDAAVLIVENCDTTAANSPQMPLEPAQRSQVVSLARTLWGMGVSSG